MSDQEGSTILECDLPCDFKTPFDTTRLVVITGGPGAGKTAVLEAARKSLCQHIAILPESAGVLYGGGFWRRSSEVARTEAQKAIFQVQRGFENILLGERLWSVGLCDRGSLDGLAYWPGDQSSFWSAMNSSLETEYARYSAVIHLRTPDLANGYNHQNLLRIESSGEALALDGKIAEIWSQHPKYVAVASTQEFLQKAKIALEAIRDEVPACCKSHFLKRFGNESNKNHNHRSIK